MCSPHDDEIARSLHYSKERHKVILHYLAQVETLIPDYIRHFLWAQLFTLYYHQQYADQYHIYYDRDRFRRLYQYLDQYCLFQYRRQSNHQDQLRKRLLGYPFVIPDHFYYLRFLLYFFLFFIFRCFAIVFIPAFTATREIRILVGTESFGSASSAIETCFLLWSSIAVLSIKYAFTDQLLDYKFMAVFRMTPNNPKYYRPSDFGLSLREFHQFSRFRSISFLYLLSAMFVIPVFGPTCLILLGARVSLFSTHLFITTFWTITLSYWILWASHIMYSNMTAFIVVAKYVQIKQNSISDSIQKCLSQMKLDRLKLNLWRRYGLIEWKHFMSSNVRYTHLQDELQEYNHFWTRYLSFAFVVYVLLASFLIYIIFLSRTEPYVKAIFIVVLSVHVVLLSAIIYLSGGLVMRNLVLYKHFTSLLAHFVDSFPQLKTYQNVKMSNLAGYLKDTPSGFSLMNGYVLSFETFQMLTINIATYFMLIVKGL